MTIGSILSIILLFVFLVIALALRDNIAQNFGPNSAKRDLLDPTLASFDQMDDDDPVTPSPKFIDRTIDPPPEDDEALAERTGFTVEQVSRLREITNGELSQFCSYDVETEEWSVPVYGIRIDRPSSSYRSTLQDISNEPIFGEASAFIVSDALGHEDMNGGIVVLMDADPLEPYRMIPAQDEDGPLSDVGILEMLEEWYEEAPFSITWASPNGFELLFETSESELVELVHDATDIFPEAVERLGGPEALHQALEAGSPVQFWWP